MKEAFKFLENNTIRPMISDVFEEDELIETVNLTDAQWACKLAVKEEFEYLAGLDEEARIVYIKSRLSYLNNKRTKLSDI